MAVKVAAWRADRARFGAATLLPRAWPGDVARGG